MGIYRTGTEGKLQPRLYADSPLVTLTIQRTLHQNSTKVVEEGRSWGAP